MSSIRAMVEECPRMKALSDFLVASPHDSDRKWAEYVALAPDLAGFLNPKRVPAAATASSTTSLSAQTRAPCDTAPITNATTTAASRVVLNAKRDSSKDDLSPEARRNYDQGTDYDYIVGNSAGSTSRDDLSPEARRIYDYLVGNSAPPPSTASPPVPSSAISNTSSSAAFASTTASTRVSTMIPSDSTPTNVPVEKAKYETDISSLITTTCSTKCSGSLIGALPAACLTTHATTSCLLPAIFSAAVTAVQSHEMVSATGEELETREAPVSMQDMLQIAPTTAEVSPTFSIVDKVMGTGTTSDVYVPHTPELTLVSIAPCSMECTNGAVASMASNDTDGDVVQPVIYNSDCVDLAIAMVPPDMTMVAASTVVALLGAGPITDVTSENDSSDSLEPDLCLLIKLFTWSPQFKWPPMPLNGPFLIARNIQQDFMEIYSMNAVVSRLSTYVVRWNEAMHWPKFSVFYSFMQPLPESFPWYIAWLLVGSSCTNSEFGVRKNLTNRWMMFVSGEELDSAIFFSSSLGCITIQLTMDDLQLQQAVRFQESNMCISGSGGSINGLSSAFPTRYATTSCPLPAAAPALHSTFLSDVTSGTRKQRQLLHPAPRPSLIDDIHAHTKSSFLRLQQYPNMYIKDSLNYWKFNNLTCLRADERIDSYINGTNMISIDAATGLLESYAVAGNRNNNIHMCIEEQPIMAREKSLVIVQSGSREFLHARLGDVQLLCSENGNIAVSRFLLDSGKYLKILFSMGIGGFTTFQNTKHLVHQVDRGSSTRGQENWDYVVLLQPKPPWPYLAPTIPIGVTESLHTIGVSLEFNQYELAASRGSMSYSCLDFERKLMGDQIITEGATYLGCQLFEWQIPWYSALCHAISSSKWLRIQPVGGHWTFKYAFLFSLDITNAIENVTSIKAHICCLSEAWVLHLPTTSSTHCGSQLRAYIMVGCLRSARNDELTQVHAADPVAARFRGNETLYLPWDPGDYSSSARRQSIPGRVDGACYCPGINTSQVPWDPGDSSRVRLGGKPNFKEGRLSTTWSIPSLGWTMGCHLLGLGPLRRHYKYKGTITDNSAGTKRMASACKARIG